MNMRPYIVGAAVALGLWGGLSSLLICTGAHKDMALVGDSLSPLAWVAAAVTLVFAFKQSNEDAAARAQQRHDDAVADRRDRLADAYVAWFEKALDVIRELSAHATHAERLALDRRPDIPESVKALREVHAREGALRIAAVPVLMLERDQVLSDRLKETFAPLPTFDKGHAGETTSDYRAFVSNLVLVLRIRQDNMTAVFEEAGRKIAG